MFDKNKEENAVKVNYFKSKIALVVDESKTVRSSLKKCLTSLGMDISNIHQATDLAEAKKVLADFKPNIVFVNKVLEDGSGVDLLDNHLNYYPNRIEAAFFVLSDTNCPANAYLILETEVDSVLLIPFNIEQLESTILRALDRKFEPTPYTQDLEGGKESLYLGEIEKALEGFDRAIADNEKAVSARSYKATVLIKNNELDEGENLLKESQSIEEAHYQTLDALRKLFENSERYEEQYDIERNILDKFPLNPIHIPDLTKLFIRSKKFEDILDFIDVAKNLKNSDPQIASHVSAGLAICGRYLASSNKKPQAKSALKKSGYLSQGKFEILKSCAETLLTIESKKYILKFLEKYSNHATNENSLALLIFKIKSEGENAQNICTAGIECIDQGHSHPKIHLTMINALIEVKGSYEKVEEMCFNAMEEYPDLKDELNEKLSRYKEDEEKAS